MATLGEMKTAIARRLLDEDNTAVTEAEIVDAINDAIQDRQNKRFWFNTVASDLSIAEGDTELDLPTNFLIDVPRNAFTITDNGSTYRVRKVNAVIFDANSLSSETGRPRDYVFRNGGIEFLPAADQAYSGVLHHLKKYDEFETNGDDDESENDFTTYGDRLIRYDALSRIHGDIRQDDKRAAYFAARAEAAEAALMDRTRKLNSTGQLTIEEGVM